MTYRRNKREEESSEALREQDLAICYADSIADNHPPRAASNLIDL